MTWRRKSGIVTAGGELEERVARFFDARAVLGMIESTENSYESIHVSIAVDDGGGVAVLDDGAIAAGMTLDEFGRQLAEHVEGEVAFLDESWVAEGLGGALVDPFEHPLGANIADFADRAVVFTRAAGEELPRIAAQVDDVIYALAYADGYILCVTEGPVLTTLQWDEATRPVLIIEHGAGEPSIAVIGDGEPHELTWGATTVHTPRNLADGGAIAEAFITATLGSGALMRETMKLFPAVEPVTVKASLSEGIPAFLVAIGLPDVLRGYLNSETEAADLPGAEEVHPASFARSVRRVMSEASTSVSERAEAMRERAVAVRARAETAFDAAEEFAEDVVLPVRQNWVSPALAATETVLGILAWRKAGRSRGLARGAFGVGGALLLSDAVVNTVVTLAPLLRRKH